MVLCISDKGPLSSVRSALICSASISQPLSTNPCLSHLDRVWLAVQQAELSVISVLVTAKHLILDNLGKRVHVDVEKHWGKNPLVIFHIQ